MSSFRRMIIMMQKKSHERPIVPQTGTWQLKTTTPKKYVIFGTDDDNMGNAKFFRMLRTYGFKYVMNAEGENTSVLRNMGDDVDTNIFTDDDAPSLFPTGVNIIELGKYLHNNGLGEVAQHGASACTLWDSEKLTGDFLTNLHNNYVSQGGTKTAGELRIAIMEQLASTDGSQGASYVEAMRTQLESDYGFFIDTVGIWGGAPSATIDGIVCDLNLIKGTTNYDWRGHNYSAISAKLGSFSQNKSPYDIPRLADSLSSIPTYINQMIPGGICEFFWHMPFNDESDISVWRTIFSAVKTMVNNGDVEVITRKGYATLGEYVSNPVTKITVTRSNINLGETDNPSAYITTATYADLTTADVSSESIVDYSSVDTSTEGSYAINATYRGFYATAQVSVINASYTIPVGLKDVSYWFIAKNNTTGKMFCGNTTGTFGSAAKLIGVLKLINCTSGKLNGWLSSDNGATWTQVNTNQTHSSVIKTDTTSGTTAFNFGNAYDDVIVFLESSENFPITYTN